MCTRLHSSLSKGLWGVYIYVFTLACLPVTIWLSSPLISWIFCIDCCENASIKILIPLLPLSCTLLPEQFSFHSILVLGKEQEQAILQVPSGGDTQRMKKKCLQSHWQMDGHKPSCAFCTKKSIHLSIQRIYFHLSDFSFAGIHCGEIWDAKELLLDLQTLPLFYVNAAYQVSLGFLYILKYSLFTLPQIEIPLFLQIKLISKMSCGHTPFRILLLYLTVNRCFSTARLFQELFCINLKPTKG